MPRVGWAVLTVLVAGCAPASDSDATGGAERTVALTIRHRSEWRVLWVEGRRLRQLSRHARAGPHGTP